MGRNKGNEPPVRLRQGKDFARLVCLGLQEDASALEKVVQGKAATRGHPQARLRSGFAHPEKWGGGEYTMSNRAHDPHSMKGGKTGGGSRFHLSQGLQRVHHVGVGLACAHPLLVEIEDLGGRWDAWRESVFGGGG